MPIKAQQQCFTLTFNTPHCIACVSGLLPEVSGLLDGFANCGSERLGLVCAFHCISHFVLLHADQILRVVVQTLAGV